MDKSAVIESLDVDTLYSVPLRLQEQGLDQIVVDYLGLDVPEADMSAWKDLEQRVQNLSGQTTIGIVGKYVELPDAYISVTEALKHAGYKHDTDVQVTWINAEKDSTDAIIDQIKQCDGIVVPGGFGERGLDGKLEAIKYVREHNIPFLGICLGMQLAAIEFARNVVGLDGAHTAEVDPQVEHNIIDLMADQADIQDMGGTQRLGLYPCKVENGTKAHEAYGQNLVEERHRHRYEFNNEYRDILSEAGLVFSGVSPDNKLVEIIELSDHPFYVASQFHPEFISRPERPQPLFDKFIEVAQANAK